MMGVINSCIDNSRSSDHDQCHRSETGRKSIEVLETGSAEQVADRLANLTLQ